MRLLALILLLSGCASIGLPPGVPPGPSHPQPEPAWPQRSERGGLCLPGQICEPGQMCQAGYTCMPGTLPVPEPPLPPPAPPPETPPAPPSQPDLPPPKQI
jgi:hypothetical protein